MKSQRSGLPLVCHPYLNVYIVNWISLFLTYACFNLILMPTFSDWWPSIGWSMFMLSSIYLSSQFSVHDSLTYWDCFDSKAYCFSLPAIHCLIHVVFCISFLIRCGLLEQDLLFYTIETEFCGGSNYTPP